MNLTMSADLKSTNVVREDKLFGQPDGTHLGECPICCLPLPLDKDKYRINSCCCKFICLGCSYANKNREIEERLEHKCPYCRELLPDAAEEHEKNYMKRVKVNDPAALSQVGVKCYIKGDYDGAFENWTKAAAVGGIDAHHYLSSFMYLGGEGVDKDMKRAVYHWQEAAIGGHPLARFNLGVYEKNAGRFDIAMKHFVIAAKLGYDEALEMVKAGFMDGTASKDEFAAALRGHQAAVDATKSKKREEAYAFHNENN